MPRWLFGMAPKRREEESSSPFQALNLKPNNNRKTSRGDGRIEQEVGNYYLAPRCEVSDFFEIKPSQINAYLRQHLKNSSFIYEGLLKKYREYKFCGSPESIEFFFGFNFLINNK